MGGIGKTELALQYAIAQLKQNQYPAGLCWLRARDQEIATQIVTFAQTHFDLLLPDQFEIDAQVRFCWQKWPEGDALVVLDDVTDYKAIESYLPPSDPRFKLLITTRLQLGSSVKDFPVEQLDEDSAIALLESLAGCERIQSQLDDAKALCKWVGYLPLALELLGRFFARKPDWTINRLLKALDDKRLEAKALTALESGMTAKLGVAAALELSWQELNEAEQELACVLGMFAIAPISWLLVEQCLAEVDPDDLEDTRDDGLMARSLLKRVGEGSYQLHQIVQEYFRIKLKLRSDQGQGIKNNFCKVITEIAQTIDLNPTIQQVDQVRGAITHLEEVANQWTDNLTNENLVWPFLGIGLFYESQFDYHSSELWHKRGLDLTRVRCGNIHPECCYSLERLADIYRKQGQHNDAENLYLQSLEIRIHHFGENYTEVATTYNGLAGICRDQGRYEKAELYYQKGLEIMSLVLGEDHSEVRSMKNNFTLLLIDQGKYEEAELILNQILDIHKRIFGEEHLEVATTISNLAGLYRNQGRYHDAEVSHTKALEIKENLLGKFHPKIATNLNNLAVVFADQGLYKDAIPLLERALEIQTKLFGEENSEVLTTLCNIAHCYQLQGQLEKAKLLYSEVLQKKRKVLGDEHPDVAVIISNLGTLSFDQGLYGEAEPLYIQALTMRKTLLGEDHPDVAKTQWKLGVLYQKQEKYNDAKNLYQQALFISEAKLGLDHSTTHDIRSCLNSLPNEL
jgi:tetratricopeptide (TPR) repeat protein